MQFNMPFKIIVSKTALMTKTGLTDIRIISILCDLCLGTPCSVEIFYDRKWYSLRIVLVFSFIFLGMVVKLFCTFFMVSLTVGRFCLV